MKKLSLVLVLLLAMGAFAFADVNASATLKFELGDSDLRANTPNLPAFGYAKSANATLSLASGDEKVVATATLDLLAAVSVTDELEWPDDGNYYPDGVLAGVARDGNDAGGDAYWMLGRALTFWADNSDSVILGATNTTVTTATMGYDWATMTGGTYTAAAGDTVTTTAWSATTLTADIERALMYDTADTGLTANEKFDFVDSVDGNTITLKNLVSGADEADEFDFAGASDTGAATLSAGYYNLQFIQSNSTYAWDMITAQLDQDIPIYLEGILTSTPITGSTIDAYDQLVLQNGTGAPDTGNLQAKLNSLTFEYYEGLTADERAALLTAIDLVLAWDDVDNGTTDDLPTVATTVVQNFIKSVTLKFPGVGGVVDITAYFGGQHVSAGAFNVDMSGHQDSSVGSYPALKIALADGVVSGLSFGLTFYTDTTDMADEVAVSDDWYTWLDESRDDAAPVDPAYALKIDGGYAADFGDSSAGATVELGMYDLLGGSMGMGFAVSPYFSGMGANINVDFSYAVAMALMKIGVAANYTIMGITPNVYFNMITNNAADDYALSYGDASSVADVVKTDADGGMELGGGVSANLADLLPLAVTISGGADVALPDNDDTYIAWNFGVSVAPTTALSVYFNGSGDAYIGNGFIFATGVNYAYSIANVYFKLYNSWDSSASETYLGWALGTTVSF